MPPQRADDLLDRRLRRAFPREVADDHLGLARRAPGISAAVSAMPVGIDVDDPDGAAAARQLDRDLAAEAAGGAGHQRPCRALRDPAARHAASPDCLLTGLIPVPIRGLSTAHAIVPSGVRGRKGRHMKITALETLRAGGVSVPVLAAHPHRCRHHRHRRDLLGAGSGRRLHPRQRRVLSASARIRATSSCTTARSAASMSARAIPAPRCAATPPSTSRSGTSTARRSASRSGGCSAAARMRACRSTTPAPATGTSAPPSGTRCSSAPRTGR